jgi:hypothetical protein
MVVAGDFYTKAKKHQRIYGIGIEFSGVEVEFVHTSWQSMGQ